MKIKNNRIGLYLILDRQYIDDYLDLARYAVQKNIKFIQYRDKSANNAEFLRIAEKILQITRNTKTNFIVNDRVSIAKQIDADGVHIGQEDAGYKITRDILPQKIIGISSHNLKQAVQAEKVGADYIGIGPVFDTSSKENPDPVIGLSRLAEISNLIKIPKVAIGGINKLNVVDVMKTGVEGCAIISSILTAKHPKKEIDKILKILNETV